MDSETISPMALIIGVLVFMALSFALALINEKILHNNKVIYP